MNARRASTATVVSIVLLLMGCVSHQMRPQKKASTVSVRSAAQAPPPPEFFHGPLTVTAAAP